MNLSFEHPLTTWTTYGSPSSPKGPSPASSQPGLQKQHSGPSLLIPVPVPCKPGEEGAGGGNSCLYLPPQMVETPKDQFAVGGSLTPLKGVPWPLPQLFICFLNKPFVTADLRGIPPGTVPTWDHPWLCLNTDLGAPLRRGRGQLLLWISAPGPGAEGLKIFWKI